MKPHTQPRTPRQRPEPLQPSQRAVYAAHAPRATSHESQITNHAPELRRHNPPTPHYYAHQTPTFLINVPPIGNVRNSQKINNGLRF
jgi:hypothetical protein